MPSERPKIVVYTENEIIEKLDKIAKSQNRSRGNLVETIVKEFLINYEAEEAKLAEKEIEKEKLKSNTELLNSKIG